MSVFSELDALMRQDDESGGDYRFAVAGAYREPDSMVLKFRNLSLAIEAVSVCKGAMEIVCLCCGATVFTNYEASKIEPKEN